MKAESVSVAAPGTKITTAWLAVIGIGSWSDAAAILAAMYSALLICEWLWKRVGRPLCERHGWVRARKRRQNDVAG